MISCFEKFKFWNNNCFHKNLEYLEMLIEINIKKLSTEDLQKLLDNIDQSSSSSVSQRRASMTSSIAFKDSVRLSIEQFENDK